MLEKVIFSFGRSIRHTSTKTWGEVDFVLWPKRLDSFSNAKENGTLRILSFQIQQTDQDTGLLEVLKFHSVTIKFRYTQMIMKA